jgi:hypothetical protein
MKLDIHSDDAKLIAKALAYYKNSVLIPMSLADKESDCLSLTTSDDYETAYDTAIDECAYLITKIVENIKY